MTLIRIGGSIRRVRCAGNQRIVALMLSLVMGFHWTVIQSAAYLGMVVRYSQTESFPTALSKTFDGLHPCSVCELVKKGRETEGNDGIPKPQLKQILLLVSTSQLVLPPQDFETLPSDLYRVALYRSLPPPLPPPRAV